jgi:YbbR domain-containing protein
MLNKQWFVFAVSFFVALLFWVLISLTKYYNGSIEAEISYENLPPVKGLSSSLPHKLQIELNTRGFDLLMYSVHLRSLRVRIDANEYLSGLSTAERKKGTLTGDYLRKVISDQLSPESRIGKISPENIFLNFSDRSLKKLPVKLNISISFDKQYGFSDSILLKPDSVLISGPENVINNIDEIETVFKKFVNVKESIHANLPLLLRKKDGLLVSDKVISVDIPVEKYTEASLEIPVEVINVKKSMIVKTMPAKVNVTFRVSLKNYKKIDAELFSAVADFSEVGQRPGSRLEVNLVKYPSFLKAVKLSPRKVDYMIRK